MPLVSENSGWAKLLTCPLIVIDCEVSGVLAKPLVPVPSDVRLMGAVPVIAPAVEVCALPPRPTTRDVLLELPAANVVIEPVPLALPVSVPKPASNPSETPAVAVFWTVSA